MQIIHQTPLAALGLGAAFTVVWGVADPVMAWAEVKTYTGVGKCAMGDLVTPLQAKNYARELAMINAREQAGVYIRSYTRTSSAKVADNEIAAIANNITEVRGEVRYTQAPGEVDGQPVVVYTATLEAKVDTNGISEWLRRDESEKASLVNHIDFVQKKIKSSLDKIQQLIDLYREAESEQEKERLRKEHSEVDQELLADQKVEEALEAYYRGEYDNAIRLNSEALALNRNYVEAYANRGSAYSDKGENDKALADYNKAIEINPRFAGLYSNRGGLYCAMGDYDKAISDCNKALSMDPHDAIAYANRGMAYNKREEYDKAIADYTRAIELNPNLADAYLQRGAVYGVKGEYRLTLADWRMYLKFKPDNEKVKGLVRDIEKFLSDK